MTISAARLAMAKRTTLTISLCAALATMAGAHRADALGRARTGNLHARATSSLEAFAEHRTAPAHTKSGNIITVDSCADDGGAGTLRKAIESASDGDTIDLGALNCALITLQSGALASSVPNLTIHGPGAGALTIDGNNADRVLGGANLNIAGVTMAHGVVLSGLGGGCLAAYGDLTLDNVDINACIAVNSSASAVGGAVVALGNLTLHHASIAASKVTGTDSAAGGGAAVGGTAALYDSAIRSNTVVATQGPAYGGGMFANGAITLHASTIEGNTAHATVDRAYGGGLHTSVGDIKVSDASLIAGNTAHSDTNWGYGGGISSGNYANQAPATVTIERSTVRGNVVESACSGCFISGGGVHAFDTINAEYSTFYGNHAQCDVSASACAASGGALSSFGVQPTSTIALSTCTISANSAIGGAQPGGFGSGGGIVGAAGERVVAHNSTIAFNHASTNGGGVATTSTGASASEIISTIVANNETDAGPSDIDAGPFGNILTLTGTNNLVMAHGAGVSLSLDTLATDPELMPLTGEDGGTIAIHPLPPDSVAVDAGANPDLLACDQREFPYRREWDASADIGAYEFQGEKHLFADRFEGSSACKP
jgi:hypothetical protein